VYSNINTRIGDAINRHLRSERPCIDFPRYWLTAVEHWARSSGQPSVPQRPLRSSGARHWMAHNYIMILVSQAARKRVRNVFDAIDRFCGEVTDGCSCVLDCPESTCFSVLHVALHSQDTACRCRTNPSYTLIQMEVFGLSILVMDGSRPCLRKVLPRSVLARCVVHAILIFTTTLIVVTLIVVAVI
jgi:hypothetical protein